jgi:hypothetical protein
MQSRDLLQVSRVYHYIRGEAIIKLYVIFNILEILDKLCASLGSDVIVSAGKSMFCALRILYPCLAGLTPPSCA